MKYSSWRKPAKPRGQGKRGWHPTPYWRTVNARSQNKVYCLALIAHPLIGPMTPNKNAFFKLLGARIAGLRRDTGLTQQVASFEIGRHRVPASLLPSLAHALAVSVEELIGETPKTVKRGPVPKLQQLERITRLPKAQQRLVMQISIPSYSNQAAKRENLCAPSLPCHWAQSSVTAARP
ncbi:MAG TPA: hypothetical protein VFN29_09040 [Chiayiivirga sp.]|nr:hypothetical protein [Chiayiivirga sp.]